MGHPIVQCILYTVYSAHYCAAVLYYPGIVDILRVNAEKCLKFHRFELVQYRYLVSV